MWIGLYVGIAAAGLVVLAAVGFWLYRQVRQAIRELKAAGERIAAVSDQLSRETAPRSGRA
ncbi:MAG TPA: hypothetical protein VHV76_09370 [Mycobacteriales bacterium]|nr:hypothetical protein [Mycobacteriales bacterium]